MRADRILNCDGTRNCPRNLEHKLDRHIPFTVPSNSYVDVVVPNDNPYVLHEQLLVMTIGQFDPEYSDIETDDTVLRIWVEPNEQFTIDDLPEFLLVDIHQWYTGWSPNRNSYVQPALLFGCDGA